MQLSRESLEEFKKIYKKGTGKELEKQEACEAASNLIGFFKLLLKIDSGEKVRSKKVKGRK